MVRPPPMGSMIPAAAAPLASQPQGTAYSAPAATSNTGARHTIPSEAPSASVAASKVSPSQQGLSAGMLLHEEGGCRRWGPRQ